MGIQEKTWKNETCDAEVRVCARCCREEVDKSCIHQHEAEQSRSDDKVSHIRSTQERLRDDRIDTRLKQNKEVKMQREKKSRAIYTLYLVGRTQKLPAWRSDVQVFIDTVNGRTYTLDVDAIDAVAYIAEKSRRKGACLPKNSCSSLQADNARVVARSQTATSKRKTRYSGLLDYEEARSICRPKSRRQKDCWKPSTIWAISSMSSLQKAKSGYTVGVVSRLEALKSMNSGTNMRREVIWLRRWQKARH